MTGRFRFTPLCCCGSEPPAPDCIEPCVPDCAEIFRGADSSLSDRFVLIDRVDNTKPNYYIPDCGDKTPFTVEATPHASDGDPYHAYISSTSTPFNGNHRCYRVRYILHYASYGSSFATYPIYYFPPVSVPVDSSLTYCETLTDDNSGAFGGSVNLYNLAYDSPALHSSSPESFRVFCLPFDIVDQPFQFCDGSTSEGLTAADYKTLSECGFSFSTACNENQDLTTRLNPVFNASAFTTYLNSLTFSNSILDFYVVRLFGFVSPVCTTSIGTVNGPEYFLLTDIAGASAQFVLTSLENISYGHEMIVCGDSCISDFPRPQEQIDWSNVDLPPGLSYFYNWTSYNQVYDSKEYLTYYHADKNDIDYPPSFYTRAWPAHNLIPFVAHQNIPCSYKFGSISYMPTVWRSPLKSVTSLEDTNENRFHGIYWILASISPCGEPFHNDVTHGILWSVPVGYFKTSGTPQSAGDMIDAQPMMYFSSSLTKDNSQFTNSDWNKTWTKDNVSHGFKFNRVANWPGDNGTASSYPTAALWEGNYLVDCFIPKPQGKKLVQLYWRVLKKNPYYPCTQPQAGFVVRCLGSITSDNDTVDQGNNVYYGLYDTTNLDKYELSVNGGGAKDVGFKEFTDSDTGQTCYVPIFGANKIREYFGSTEPKIFILSAQATILYFANDVKIYPRLDFGYIAVWENE